MLFLKIRDSVLRITRTPLGIFPCRVLISEATIKSAVAYAANMNVPKLPKPFSRFADFAHSIVPFRGLVSDYIHKVNPYPDNGLATPTDDLGRFPKKTKAKEQEELDVNGVSKDSDINSDMDGGPKNADVPETDDTALEESLRHEAEPKSK